MTFRRPGYKDAFEFGLKNASHIVVSGLIAVFFETDKITNTLPCS